MSLTNYSVEELFQYQQALQGATLATVLANLDSYTEFDSMEELLKKEEFHIINQQSDAEDIKGSHMWSVSFIGDRACNIYINFPIYSQLLLVCATISLPLDLIPRYRIGPNQSAYVTVSICNENLVHHLSHCIDRYAEMAM